MEESIKSTSEVLNGNINISKQIQNTNELLNYVIVNLIWIIIFGVIVLLGLLVFLIVKNKKDSKKAVLESFENIFGSEGSELKNLFADMSEVKKEIIKLNVLVDLKEKDRNFFEQLVSENDGLKKNLKEWLKDLEKNNKELYNYINENIERHYADTSDETKKMLDTFGTELYTKMDLLDNNLNEMIFGMGKKFYENNKNTLMEIQNAIDKINKMCNIVEKGKVFNDDELFEIIFSNSSLIIFKVQIAIMSSICYPCYEVDQNRLILFSNLDAIFENAIRNARNRLKVSDKRLQTTLESIDVILEKLESTIKDKLNNYFNLHDRNEIEIMRTLRAITKICDNTITETETVISTFYKR